jgi:hypothetical protein
MNLKLDGNFTLFWTFGVELEASTNDSQSGQQFLVVLLQMLAFGCLRPRPAPRTFLVAKLWTDLWRTVNKMKRRRHQSQTNNIPAIEFWKVIWRPWRKIMTLLHVVKKVDAGFSGQNLDDHLGLHRGLLQYTETLRPFVTLQFLWPASKIIHHMNKSYFSSLFIL